MGFKKCCINHGVYVKASNMVDLVIICLYMDYLLITGNNVMSAYFCPHLMFNFGFLVEFVCLTSDLINSYDN